MPAFLVLPSGGRPHTGLVAHVGTTPYAARGPNSKAAPLRVYRAPSSRFPVRETTRWDGLFEGRTTAGQLPPPGAVEAAPASPKYLVGYLDVELSTQSSREISVVRSDPAPPTRVQASELSRLSPRMIEARAVCGRPVACRTASVFYTVKENPGFTVLPCVSRGLFGPFLFRT